MGGAETEVGPETTAVLLEAAAFDNISIRRTSRLQKLPSESAARFGRGVHPDLTEPASVRCAGLFSEVAGGAVVEGVVDSYPRPPEPVVVTLPGGELKRILGIDVSIDDAARILERLEFEVEAAPDGGLTATVPPHRMDVAIPADLVEEVARIYGYDRLPSTRLADPLPEQRDNPELSVEEASRDALAAAGLLEAASVRLVAIEHEANLWPADPPDTATYVTLTNPVSPERSSLRHSILTGLLDAARLNLRFTDRMALFEIGPVYLARPDGLPDEPRRVGLLMAGRANELSWHAADDRTMDFFDAKGAVQSLLGSLNVSARWEPGTHPAMHPARTAAVMVGEAVVGHVGELRPRVREYWGLGDLPVAVAELDLDALAAAREGSTQFVPFSQYPPVHEDLAVVVDDATPADEVADVIRSAGGSLLVGLSLFDVYKGSQIGQGKKSLAWSLTFQAQDKTLTSEAATAVRGQIVKALSQQLGATIRS
jgi:phenylalanyl-tRNA synthetase beta chain